MGGGADPDGTQYSLSDITLRWMVREICTAQCGIRFDSAALQRLAIPADAFPSLFSTPSSPSSPAGADTGKDAGEEARLDNVDSAQPVHDELKMMPLWWLLEIIPLPYAWQDAQGVWRKKWSYVPPFLLPSIFSCTADTHTDAHWIWVDSTWARAAPSPTHIRSSIRRYSSALTMQL